MPTASGAAGLAPASKPAGPAWATPKRLLALFCIMCLFIYLDRGMIASNGVNGAAATAEHPASGIQGDFGLSLFQDGLLPAAFMVGLLASSPVFAEASKHRNGFRLIGVGLAVWTAAAAGCGLAPGFASLLLCRMAVGVGEASFVALAAPFIDDNAPPTQKALWLGVFYCCIPTGYALGYIYGGLVGGSIGWRAAFLMEAAAMLPFVVFCLRAPPISLRGASPPPTQEHEGSGEGSGHPGGPLDRLRGTLAAVGQDLRLLASHPIYLWNVGGMTVYTAVLGTFAFYGPKAGREMFDIQPERADLTFGAITVLTGTLGTLAGGTLLDAMGSSMRNALLLCTLGITLGGALSVAAFWLATSFPLFSFVFALAQMAMFTSSAPSNAVSMWCVPSELRPFAMSMSVVAIHVLGDVPSPPLLGALQGRLQNWRLSMSLASSLLLLGAAAYLVAASTAKTAVDYRQLGANGEEEEEEEELPGRGSGSMGLQGDEGQQQRQQHDVGDEESGRADPGVDSGAPGLPLLPPGKRS